MANTHNTHAHNDFGKKIMMKKEKKRGFFREFGKIREGRVHELEVLAGILSFGPGATQEILKPQKQ